MLQYAESCCAALLLHRCFLQGRKCKELRVFDISDPLHFNMVFTGKMDSSCFLKYAIFPEKKKNGMPN